MAMFSLQLVNVKLALITVGGYFIFIKAKIMFGEKFVEW